MQTVFRARKPPHQEFGEGVAYCGHKISFYDWCFINKEHAEASIEKGSVVLCAKCMQKIYESNGVKDE